MTHKKDINTLSPFILKGKRADKTLREILDRQEGDIYPHLVGACGYFKEFNPCTQKTVWIAFDNTTADCWVEEFATQEQALAWINDSIDEIKNFKPHE